MTTDYTPPPLICPTCGGPSTSPGPCPVCMSVPDDPYLDLNAWIAEALSDARQEHLEGAAPEGAGHDYADLVCPSCSGPSPTGGPCPACEAMESADVDTSMLHDHHIYPQEFRERFDEAGVDVDLFTVTLYDFQHRLLHCEGWNADWDMFFESADLGGMPPNRADVEDFGRFLMEKYGFAEAEAHPYRDRSGELGPYV